MRRASVALGVTAIALSGVFASAAGAQTQNAPPGWVDPGGNAWVAFTLSDYSPDPVGRSGYESVNLQRTTSASPAFDLSWFSNWEAIDADGTPGPEQWRWPLVWEGGGMRLERVDACDYTQTECRYNVVSGSGPFWFFGGTPPESSPGVPDPNPASFYQGDVSLAPLPTITIGPLGAVGIAGSSGAAGKIHLDAPGTVDELAGTTLTYHWTLVHIDTGTTYDSGPVTDDFYEPTVQHDGDYCVQVSVTASDGHTVGTPTCASGTGALFNITGVAPAPSGGGGGGGGGGTPPPATGGGGGGSGGGGLPGIGFSNPANRAPSVLTGGGGGGASPTVVWLWRPEWYQPEPEVEARPQTTGQPVLTERKDIVITGGTRNGSNAGPWLAGLGIAGALGGGWLVSRRRRMRMLAEL